MKRTVIKPTVLFISDTEVLPNLFGKFLLIFAIMVLPYIDFIYASYKNIQHMFIEIMRYCTKSAFCGLTVENIYVIIKMYSFGGNLHGDLIESDELSMCDA